MVRRLQLLMPGVGVAILLAGFATALGHAVPVVGAPVFAIVGGVTVSLLRPVPAAVRPGLGFASKAVLQGRLWCSERRSRSGRSSRRVRIGTDHDRLAGHRLGWCCTDWSTHGYRTRLRTLIGVGTAICGASAIAATDAVISATEADVSYSIATIFTFNIAAVLTFPSLGTSSG